MTIEQVKEAIENNEGYYEYYAVRADCRDYAIGDICDNSHQLFHSQDWDEDGNPLFEESEDGRYDAGELDGTCGYNVTADIDNITKWMSETKDFADCENGSIYLIAGNQAEFGLEENEVIINEAVVIGKVDA